MAWHFLEPDVDKFRTSITERQYLVWREWLKRQWNRPDRHDHYAMQISRDIVNFFGNSPMPISKRKITWDFAQTEEEETTEDGKKVFGPPKVTKADWEEGYRRLMFRRLGGVS